MRRFNCLFAMGVAIGLPLFVRAADDPPEAVKLVISKETSFVDGPLREDGLVDYVQAFEKIWSAGVSKGNNAAPLIIRAYGPTFYHDDELLGIACRKLGVAAPAAKGDYIVHLDTLLGVAWNPHVFDGDLRTTASMERGLKLIPAHILEDAHESYRTREAFDEAIKKQLATAWRSPWSLDDYPFLYGWLTANEQSLKLVKEACGRSRYFLPAPLEPGKGVMMGLLMPALGKHREVAKALVARSMFHLKSGDKARAWEDLLTVYRLASLTSEDPILISNLVAISLEALAFDATIRLAVEGEMSESQLKAQLAALSAIKPRQTVVHSIDIGERFMILDAVSMMKRDGLEAVTVSSAEESKKLPPLTEEERRQLAELTDPNVILKSLNDWFNDMVRGDSLATFAERTKAQQAFTERLRKNKETVGRRFVVYNPKRVTQEFISRAMVKPAGQRRETFSREVADFLAAMLVPDIGKAIEMDDYARMRIDLSRTTLALAAYRAKVGRYPASLADLSPEFLAEIPKDRFTDKPLLYSLKPGGFLLYSVGANQKDDGGESRTDDRKFLADLAVRVENGKYMPAELP